MSAKHSGGPAFPVSHDIPPRPGEARAILTEYGMSLRDWYAGMAMQGMLAAFKRWPTENDLVRVAELAGTQADAMLAEREKGGAS